VFAPVAKFLDSPPLTSNALKRMMRMADFDVLLALEGDSRVDRI
jgi:hypothetical protein